MGLDRDTEYGRRVITIGNSVGVTIESTWRDRLDVEPGDRVDAEVDLDEGTVTLHF